MGDVDISTLRDNASTDGYLSTIVAKCSNGTTQKSRNQVVLVCWLIMFS